MRGLLLLMLVFWPFYLAFASSDNSASQAVNNGTLYFFVHGDWGKGGYNGDFHDRRTRQLDGDYDGGAYDDGAEEEEQHEEEHDHGEEVFYQMVTSQAMQRVASRFPPSFIMALGDNFYQDGVYSSTDDPMWQTHFKWVYFNESDALKVPWHAVIGNHDLGYGDDGVAAQINRMNDTDDDMWQTPAQWYTIKYDIPDGGFVQVICVDTTWLSPSESEATNEEGGISTDTQAARLTAQLDDLKAMFNATLAAPRPTWLIVAGHYNIHSAGEKGDNEELITYLVPLMEQYGVHAYICGHDHVNEHLQSNGIDYFVAGASSMNNEIEDDDSVTIADLLWAGESYSAFALFEATAYTLTVRYVASINSSYVYNYTLNNPNQVDWSDFNDDFADIVTRDDGLACEDEDGYYLTCTFRSIFIWAQNSAIVRSLEHLALGICVTCCIAFIMYLLMRHIFVILTTPSKDDESLIHDRDMYRMDDDDDDDGYGHNHDDDLESPTRRPGGRQGPFQFSSRRGINLSRMFSKYQDYDLLQQLKSLKGDNTLEIEQIENDLAIALEAHKYQSNASSPHPLVNSRGKSNNHGTQQRSPISPAVSYNRPRSGGQGSDQVRVTGETTYPTESHDSTTESSESEGDSEAEDSSKADHSSVSFADLDSVDKKAVNARLRSYLSEAMLAGNTSRGGLSIDMINEEEYEYSSLDNSTEQGHPMHQILNLPSKINQKRFTKSKSDSSISSLTVDDTASSALPTNTSFNSKTRKSHGRRSIFRQVSREWRSSGQR